MAINIARLRIIEFPDPRLRKSCAPIERFDAALAALANRMLALMREVSGIGLAAPQVGILARMFVCNVSGEPGDEIVFVNPRPTLSGDTEVGDEGCLSIPDVTVAVTRHRICFLEAQDLDGNAIQYDASDIAARCWQHECDHLDGRLIIDRMADADRIANRRALKALEAKFKEGVLRR